MKNQNNDSLKYGENTLHFNDHILPIFVDQAIFNSIFDTFQWKKTFFPCFHKFSFSIIPRAKNCMIYWYGLVLLCEEFWSMATSSNSNWKITRIALTTNIADYVFYTVRECLIEFCANQQETQPASGWPHLGSSMRPAFTVFGVSCSFWLPLRMHVSIQWIDTCILQGSIHTENLVSYQITWLGSKKHSYGSREDPKFRLFQPKFSN